MSTASSLNAVTPPLKFTVKGRRLLQACIGVTALALTALMIALLWSQQPLAPAVAADESGVESYEQIVVQPGDTLWGISARLSQDVNQVVVLEQILQYNDLDSSELEVGQTLYVPAMD